MKELVAKNTYSPGWAFFGLKKDHEEDDDSVICHPCQAINWHEEEIQTISIQPSKSLSRKRACFDRKEQEKEDISS